MDAPSSNTSTHLPPRTLRLTFTYTRTDVRLTDSQRVEMLAPAGETERIVEGQAGSWVELRDVEQHVLYQRVLHKPIRFEMEAVEDPESGTMRWHPIDRPTGMFELALPEIAEAHTVHLYASLPDAVPAAAEEVVRLVLAEAAPHRPEEP